MVMRWDDNAVLNAPRLMAQMELEFMVRGKDRESTPLFTTKAVANKPVKFADVEGLLRPLLVVSGGCLEEEAILYSWHSFRIFLACALKAAGTSDADTQVMLRWKSAASLHAYVRMDQEDQIALLEAGLQAGIKIDVRQAANLPELDDYFLGHALEAMVAAVDRLPSKEGSHCKGK